MSMEQPVSGKKINGNEEDSAQRRVDNIYSGAVMHKFVNFS